MYIFFRRLVQPKSINYISLILNLVQFPVIGEILTKYIGDKPSQKIQFM